ncbi:MAG: SDR family NAD(P)-dependent oxidoreductase [Desulfobacteraceae bacterium]|jgi:short-subunit dehydrogenase/MoaA/NifB/PqqE/SkfB family radical SAM enzyme
MEKYSFSGKHVLVTGATGGLGSALVRNLAEMDAHLVVTARSMKALNELISTLPESARAVPLTADLSKPGDAEELAKRAIAAMGYIDVLFNNAGIGYFALMEEAKEENIRHLYEVNTFGPMALIRGLVPQMKARGGGRIINVVSCAGRVPIPTVGVYGGSKSALAVMANTMRLELEPAGIDIINVYPGTADTSFEENALREEERPGLCPTDHCGLPRYDIAEQVLEAAEGPPGEVWLERQGRWLSAASLIWPKYVERRLAPIRDKVVKVKSLKKRRWRLFQVESAMACNLECVMCPWKGVRSEVGARGIMSQEIWEAIRPYLTDVRSVDFSGGGEALLQPRLVEWIGEAKAAGCETGFLTNGLLLKKKTARQLIAAGLDWIGISMDGATAETYEEIRKNSNFEKVCENVGHIAALRAGKVPKTMINFVLMSMNFHQVEEIVRLAARLGVDQVNFKQCDVIRGEHGKRFGLFATEETKEVRRLEKSLAKARRLAKKLKVQTTAFPFTPSELPVCEQDPRDSLFIRSDGVVAPCISLAYGGPTTFIGKEVNMPSVHYGRLPDEDLLGLWESETCKFYRERFQNRVKAQEDAIVESLIGASSNRYKTLETAREAMPDAPEGCRVCHYLYDI